MLVVASMIGTGVYTTSGYLVRDLGSPLAVVLAWGVGGLGALAGALSYAELGAALPKNGGEAALLGRIYDPALGFVAGFGTFVVGFAAPIAACASAFGSYAHAIDARVPPFPAAVAALGVMTVAQLARLRTASRVQDVLTIVKIALATGLAIAGLASIDTARLVAPGARPVTDAVVLPAFAVGLVFVSYAYSGWNAASYVAGEMRAPDRSVPRALLAGTLLVTVLYVALNVVFVASAPAETLSGVTEVAHVAARALWGDDAARLVSLVVAVGLVAAIGAFLMTGARVLDAMVEQVPRLAPLATRTRAGTPAGGVVLQAALALVMLATASYDALLAWVGVTLTALAALTAAGVIVLRLREPGLARPYRTLLYPLPPLVFLALSVWMIAFAIVEEPAIVLAAWGTCALAAILYVALGPHGRAARSVSESGP
jgi:APA family basic amino acid/polyamine antiporter